MASDSLAPLVEGVAEMLPCSGTSARCGQYDQPDYICPSCMDVAGQVVRATLAALADPYTAITLLDRVGVTARTPPHEVLAALVKLAEDGST